MFKKSDYMLTTTFESFYFVSHVLYHQLTCSYCGKVTAKTLITALRICLKTCSVPGEQTGKFINFYRVPGL